MHAIFRPAPPREAPSLSDSGQLFRLTAFSTTPSGGNPAGVWVGDALPDAATMQRIAFEVNCSETAFLAPATGSERTVRYFSPLAEVPFCGHATIASGVQLGVLSGDGTYLLHTSAGDVPVTVRTRGALREASLTSVVPRSEPATLALVREALALLRWNEGDLDPAIPPARAFAGAWHLVLAVKTAKRLATLDYDFEGLKAFMLREKFTTLQLVWRESPTVFHARNPFPIGGMFEDPATGAAAAALGGYLRSKGIVSAPVTLTIHQGHDLGRPSLITVDVPAEGGIVVSGNAVAMETRTA